MGTTLKPAGARLEHEGARDESGLAATNGALDADNDQRTLRSLPVSNEGSVDDLDRTQTCTSDGSVTPERSVVDVGTYIGRYRVDGVIGSGGMGTVYEAFDPQLQRRVALKLLAFEDEDIEAAARHRARMLREAFALARLSHPNIVAVHDAGEVNAGVFIAMELIDGETVDQWVRAKPRSLGEVIQIFVAAGEGLAAAHRAKLLHRDFKPQNMMVARDGRVRVIDFGLVRGQDVSVSAPPAARPSKARPVPGSGEGWDSHSAGAQLTAAGIVAGTPRYMSPEQRLAAELDARSDQYSFCLVMREMVGLAVASPSNETLNRTSRSTVQGDALPRWLRKILARGLQSSPDARYPDMDALLSDLRRDRKTVLARASVGVAIATAALSLTWMITREEPAEVCRKGAEVSAWQQGTRSKTRAALVQKGGTFSLAFATLDPLLTAFDKSWAQSYVATCDDTHVRFTQSAPLFDHRMSCLTRKREQVGALVASLPKEADSKQVRSTVEALARVASVADCSQAAFVNDVPPLPADPRKRQLADHGFRAADTAESMLYSGRFKEANEAALQAERDGESSGYRPLTATGLLFQSMAQDRLGDYPRAITLIKKSLLSARVSSAKRLETRGFLVLINIFAQGLLSLDRAEDAAFSAELGLSALAEGGDLRAEYALTMGRLYQRKSDYPSAIKLLQQAISFYAAKGEDGALKLAESRFALSNPLMETGKYEEARVQLRSALDVFVTRFGEYHPTVAAVLNSFGAASWYAGDLNAAADFYERAVKVHIQTVGENHSSVGKATYNLSSVLLEKGRIDEAEAAAQHALKVILASLGTDNVMAAILHAHLAKIDLARGHYEAALPKFDAAFAAFAKSGSIGTLHAIETKYTYGRVALAHADLATAGKWLREAEAGYATLVGKQHPYYAANMVWLAELAYREHQYSEARKLDDGALEILGPDPSSSPLALANAYYLRATLNKRDGGDAKPWAERALETLKTADDLDSTTLREEVRHWVERERI